MNNNIDDIFSDKLENEINTKIKRNRKKLNLQLISIGTIVTLLIIILSSIGLNLLSHKYISDQFSKDLDITAMKYQICYPDSYISNQKYLETGLFKFQTTYTISKKIGGKLLLADLVNTPGGLSKNNISKEGWFISEPFPEINNDINSRPSTPYGLRELLFMYPYVNYPENINDFNLLSEIDKDKTIEMALSFNKEYDYTEVNQLIDSDLISFYWTDDTRNLDDNISYNIENNAYTSENSVIGIKSTRYNGTTIKNTDDRLSYFKDCINYFKENHDPNINSDIDLDNIKISGIVVIGSPEQLITLQNNPMIKHSILGNVVDKY